MRKIYPVIILIATLLMGIGYAAVNSVLLGIDGTAGASLYEGIYITDQTMELLPILQSMKVTE